MPKCKLNNGNVYSFTNEQYESILLAGIFIEKVEDEKKPEVLKDKIQPKEA
jgi:hypothetical protein